MKTKNEFLDRFFQHVNNHPSKTRPFKRAKEQDQ